MLDRKQMSLKHEILSTYYKFPLLGVLMFPLIALRRIFFNKWVSRKLLDDALEHLFVEPPLLSVLEFEGEFRAGTKSDLLKRLLWKGTYEPELARLTRLLIDPQRDVVDIGANIGFFTVLSAKHTKGKVFAVEPVPKILMLLRQNLLHNGVESRVDVFEGVICDSTGTISMRVVSGHEEYSSTVQLVHPSAEGRAIRNIEVTALTLDDLVLNNGLNVGFVKIDVEGAEHKVLMGARNTIVKMRPVIMSEFSPKLLRANGADPSEIIKRLQKDGYRVVDPLFPGLIPGCRKFGDLLALPEERFSRSELRRLLKDIH